MRMLGALLFFAACFYGGIVNIQSLNDRERCLNAVTDSLMHLRNALAMTNAALPDIFSYLSGQCSGQAGTFFKELENEIVCIGERRFSEIWSHAVKNVFDRLDGKEYRMLSKLGHTLGGLDSQTQVREIENCENSFSYVLDEFMRELPQRRKLALGLSTTVGAFAAILLI